MLETGIMSDPEDRLRVRLLELIAYLASAARGNVDEAQGYGPYRLLEGVTRVVRVLSEFGLSDTELDELSQQLANDAMKIIGDDDLARQMCDRVLKTVVDRLDKEGAGR